MTHIENILPEVVGSEVHRLSVDDADKLSATAIKDIVTHSTGCSLTMPDGSPATDVEELIALCTAVLRSHWQKPLTMLDGQSLQDLISRLIGNRVKGDDTFGIPAFTDSLSEAVSAIEDRKVSGCHEVADGMSLVQLLCSDYANTITELVDDNEGWTYMQSFPWSSFPNLTKITLGCSDVYGTLLPNLTKVTKLSTPNLKLLNGDGRSIVYINNSILTEDITINNIEEIRDYGSYTSVRLVTSNSVVKNITVNDLNKTTKTGGYNYDVYGQIATGCSSLIRVSLPDIKVWDSGPVVGNTPNIEEILMPNLTSLKLRSWGGLCSSDLGNYPNIKKIIFGALTQYDSTALSYGTNDNLMHLEFGEGTECALSLSNWSPTTALTDNLLQFLSNFREFLFLRLADRTGQSALTLTLSQAVYQAITGTDTTTTALTLTLADLGVTELTEKEVEAGVTLATTYATWLETYRDRINWNIGYV